MKKDTKVRVLIVKVFNICVCMKNTIKSFKKNQESFSSIHLFVHVGGLRQILNSPSPSFLLISSALDFPNIYIYIISSSFSPPSHRKSTSIVRNAHKKS